MQDPILTPSLERFTLFPIKYHKLWDLYKRGVASFWTVEEIDLNYDVKHFETLNKDEQHFIKHVLGFFAAADGIVMQNIDAAFSVEVQIAEARLFYAYQTFSESVHSETYSLLIDTLIKDEDEKQRLFKSIETYDAIRAKAEWAMKWMSSGSPFAQRLVAFAFVEGLHFSGAFCSIFWLKKRGIMPGLTFSNELISRDEGLHTTFAVSLLHMLQEKPGEDVIHAIATSAVAVEKAFICEALPCSLIGMNADMMSEYIEFVCDRLLVDMGVSKIYHTRNPFEWMELISMEGKTNFFERRVAEYAKAGVVSSISNGAQDNHTFALDDDF